MRSCCLSAHSSPAGELGWLLVLARTFVVAVFACDANRHSRAPTAWDRNRTNRAQRKGSQQRRIQARKVNAACSPRTC